MKFFGHRIPDLLIEGDTASWATVGVNLVAMLVPLSLALWLVPHIAPVAFLTAMPCFIGVRSGGYALGAMIPLVVGATGILTLEFEYIAAPMAALLSVGAGVFGKFGYARPAIAAIVTWTVYTGPIIPAGHSAEVFIVQASTIAWALVVLRLAKAGRTMKLEKGGSRRYGVFLGFLMAAGMGVSALVGQQFSQQHGFWFPLAFAALCLPPHSAFFGRAVKRTIGTVVGVGVAFLLGFLTLPTWLSITLGLA